MEELDKPTWGGKSVKCVNTFDYFFVFYNKTFNLQGILLWQHVLC